MKLAKEIRLLIAEKLLLIAFDIAPNSDETGIKEDIAKHFLKQVGKV